MRVTGRLCLGICRLMRSSSACTSLLGEHTGLLFREILQISKPLQSVVSQVVSQVSFYFLKLFYAALSNCRVLIGFCLLCGC